MSLYQALLPYKGQRINIILKGFDAPMPGTLKLVSEPWIIMDTAQTIKQYIATDEVVSFWSDSDSKKVEE